MHDGLGSNRCSSLVRTRSDSRQLVEGAHADPIARVRRSCTARDGGSAGLPGGEDRSLDTEGALTLPSRLGLAPTLGAFQHSSQDRPATAAFSARTAGLGDLLGVSGACLDGGEDFAIRKCSAVTDDQWGALCLRSKAVYQE